MNIKLCTSSRPLFDFEAVEDDDTDKSDNSCRTIFRYMVKGKLARYSPRKAVGIDGFTSKDIH